MIGRGGACSSRKTNDYRKQSIPSKNRWGVFIDKLEFDREFIQNHCNIVNYLFTLQLFRCKTDLPDGPQKRKFTL